MQRRFCCVNLKLFEVREHEKRMEIIPTYVTCSNQFLQSHGWGRKMRTCTNKNPQQSEARIGQREAMDLSRVSQRYPLHSVTMRLQELTSAKTASRAAALTSTIENCTSKWNPSPSQQPTVSVVRLGLPFTDNHCFGCLMVEVYFLWFYFEG